MSILALILYGSCARQDDDEKSDVDLLGLSDEAMYKSSAYNKTSLSVRPLKDAVRSAETGDLFMLHIVTEGKAIYDHGNYFDSLKKSFRYREKYAREMSKATKLGKLIISWENGIVDYHMINKRIAWCVRTILIARAAEKRTPVFSAAALTDFSRKPYVLDLIKGKNCIERKEERLRYFQNFLDEFGYYNASLVSKNSNRNSSISDFRKKIGMKTSSAESLIRSFLETPYE